jgi:hypothetical protein
MHSYIWAAREFQSGVAFGSPGEWYRAVSPIPDGFIAASLKKQLRWRHHRV